MFDDKLVFDDGTVYPILCCAIAVGKRDLFLGLVFFQVFHPSACTTCFGLLVMGLGPKLLNFST